MDQAEQADGEHHRPESAEDPAVQAAGLVFAGEAAEFRFTCFNRLLSTYWGDDLSAIRSKVQEAFRLKLQDKPTGFQA